MHFALMLNIEASWHATPGDFGGESACSLRVAVCWASAGAGGWGCTSRGLRDEAHPGGRVKSWRLIGSKLGVLGVPKYWGWEGGRREEPYPGEPCNFKVSLAITWGNSLNAEGMSFLFLPYFPAALLVIYQKWTLDV